MRICKQWHAHYAMCHCCCCLCSSDLVNAVKPSSPPLKPLAEIYSSTEYSNTSEGMQVAVAVAVTAAAAAAAAAAAVTVLSVNDIHCGFVGCCEKCKL